MSTITWHDKEIDGVLKAVGVNKDTGLSDDVVFERRKKYGNNNLPKGERFSMLRAAIKQLISPLSLVLILALIATIVLGEYLDAFVIAVALTINTVIGILQEGRAAKVFEALEKSQERTASVLRNSKKIVIPIQELVQGDIVFLEGGKNVPADLRLLSSDDLAINESALTGEWVASEKNAKVLPNDTTVPEMTNMTFMGTLVTQGYGMGVVIGTGHNTKLGVIAHKTQNTKQTETPLQKHIGKVAKMLMVVIGISVSLIFLIGVSKGEQVAEMLLVAIAISVAAMPEGLPAAVTVVLALAMEAVLKKGGLVKSLLAAETLGSTTIILTDKTGTLTKGVMEMFGVYYAKGSINELSEASGDAKDVLRMAVLASDGFIDGKNDDGTPKVHGRALEQAIISGGLVAGLAQDKLFDGEHARVEFLQFEASRRYAASLNIYGQEKRVYLSGSPEHILALCSFYLQNGEVVEITDEIRKHFISVQDTLSAEGKRFTAVAYKQVDGVKISDDIKKPQGDSLDFVFGGLLSFSDSIREDVPSAISTAQKAGVHVIMATGDHGATAKSVAVDVGIATESEDPVLGSELAKLTDVELLELLKTRNIFARVLPEQKLRIAKVLRNSDEVVAMTGDGINDAPALVTADIGIAVGSGTDVAKEAADMILVDNSFSVIITAIKEGRRALANIRKIIAYLLSTSFSEIILIGGALFVGMPLPLLPGQILWANIIEEGFMSFPFAFEPSSDEIMDGELVGNKGRENDILGDGFGKLIIVISIVTGVLVFILYSILLSMDIPLEEVRTFMFAAVSLDSIFFAFSFKNLKLPIWKIDLLSNKYLIGGLFISLTLLVLALTWAPLMIVLSLQKLTLIEILVLTFLGILNLLIIEIVKWFFTEKHSG